MTSKTSYSKLLDDLARIRNITQTDVARTEANPKSTAHDKAYSRGVFAGVCEAIEIVLKYQPKQD